MNKKELKKKVVEIINSKYRVTNRRRLETICRAKINRLSYELTLGDRCIYLERDGKKIFIESRCRVNEGDGWGNPAYVKAYEESKKILEELKAWYEETVCDNKQAV
jgi:hypothetical protein